MLSVSLPLASAAEREAPRCRLRTTLLPRTSFQVVKPARRRVNNSAAAGKLQGGELRKNCVEGALERGLVGRAAYQPWSCSSERNPGLKCPWVTHPVNRLNMRCELGVFVQAPQRDEGMDAFVVPPASSSLDFEQNKKGAGCKLQTQGKNTRCLSPAPPKTDFQATPYKEKERVHTCLSHLFFLWLHVTFRIEAVIKILTLWDAQHCRGFTDLGPSVSHFCLFSLEVLAFLPVIFTA